MLGKKCGRAAHDGVVKIIAQVGDHAVTGVVYQVRAGVVADSLEYGRADQRYRNHGPGVGEMRRHQLLQGNGMVSDRNDKQLNIFRSGRGIQHPVKDGTNQQELEGIEGSDQCHQHNRRQYLPPIGERVADKARQLAHTAPGRGQLPSLAACGISIRCKPLFYCSGAGLSLIGGCPHHASPSGTGWDGRDTARARILATRGNLLHNL